MAAEAKRGCGYRKVGGTYLVSSGDGSARNSTRRRPISCARVATSDLVAASRRSREISRSAKHGCCWRIRTLSVAPPSEQPEPVQKVLIEGGPAGDVEVKYLPGIFTLWRPTRIEKICKESQRDSEEVADLVKRGITPVFVPDDDKDHMGSVYDAEEEEAAVEA